MASAALSQVRLTVPVAREDLEGLKLGTVVFLDGIVFTGREGVYKKVVDEGAALPPGLSEISNANFHCSPAAARDPDGSFRVGGVTATASFRFSQWMKRWLEVSGCKLIVGKGGMAEADYRTILAPAGAIYLTTVGYGTGALLGRGIRRVADVHWLDELGLAQALWVFEVANFGPLLVESDLAGNSLFESQGRQINANIDRLYEGLREPALHRYGETADRKREVM
jgi:L(+)-tartrate dehydratase beta subunit